MGSVIKKRRKRMSKNAQPHKDSRNFRYCSNLTCWSW